MENYNITVNLTGLLKVATTEAKIDGKLQKCIVIPVEPNNIFENKKGALYLNLKAYEDSNNNFGKSHYIKQVIPLPLFNKLKEEHKQQPIIGNMSVAELKQNSYAPPTVEFSGDLKDLPF